MKPLIYVAENELTSPQFCAAFARGSGGRIVQEYQPGPWAGFGSPKIWGSLTQAMKDGHNFYYGDHGYFGRGKFYRVTRNRFQHDGAGEPNLKRLAPFYEHAAPWKKNGAHIVVCPQSDNHHERFGELGWLQRVLATLGEFTDRKIIIRTKKQSRPLWADLQNAWCVVTHTSNAAVESIMAGIPAICTGDCAASRLSLSDPANVEKPYYPDVDRLAWAGVLAANQWTLDEIAMGKCWKKVNHENI